MRRICVYAATSPKNTDYGNLIVSIEDDSFYSDQWTPKLNSKIKLVQALIDALEAHLKEEPEISDLAKQTISDLKHLKSIKTEERILRVSPDDD